MKKHLVLLIGLVVFSCSLDNDSSTNTYQDPMPIETVTLPEEFVKNETYEIIITYLRPTTSHAFNNIFHQKNNNESTVVVLGTVFQSNGNCTNIGTELEASFNFTATQRGTYVFKFWQGENENAEDQYLTIEVPVIE